MTDLSRRRFLAAAFAAGAVMTAEGLWVPGRKLISIPRALPPLILRKEDIERVARELAETYPVPPTYYVIYDAVKFSVFPREKPVLTVEGIRCIAQDRLPS